MVRLLKKDLHESSAAQLSDYLDIFKLYNQSDLAGLEAQEKQARADSEEYYQRMVLDRNQAWLEAITPLFKEKACLMEVGTLHLLGAEGLLKGLSAAGFEVTAVEYNT